MNTEKASASNPKIGTMVECIFQSKHGLLFTLANIVGANVKVLEIEEVPEGYLVAFFVHVDRDEIESADIELMWPGIDLTKVNQAVAEAVIDAAIMHYREDSLEQLRETYAYFNYYFEETVNQIETMFKSLELFSSFNQSGLII